MDRSKPICCIVCLAAFLALAASSFAGAPEAVENSVVVPGASLTEKAKRAGAKGAATGADSMMKGATVEDSAKKGGSAAIDEALRPAQIPSVPGGSVSTAPPVD